MIRNGLHLILALALASSLSPPAGAQAEPAAPHLTCDIGPVEKRFGNTRWLAYSCDDNRSVILVSAPGNPAMPFVFSLFARGETYQMRGEGTGSKAATAAAWAEISRLSVESIAALVAETKQKSN